MERLPVSTCPAGRALIHAGRFDGVRQPGEGVLTAALRLACVRVLLNEQIADMAAALARGENRPGVPRSSLTGCAAFRIARASSGIPLGR